MSGIVFPNVANALALKSQLDAQDFQMERQRKHDEWLMQDRAEGRELQRQQRQLQLDAAQRKKLEDAANDTTQTALAVLNAAEPDRPAVYQTGLQYLKSRGHDVSKLPPQYSPGMDGMLKFYVQKAESVTDFLKRQAETPQPMGLPGAPASGDVLARSGAAISGIESAGQPNGGYGAIGPQTKQGRAYGKFQVMDFNVGPWTAEVTGKAMTPQEFLANPQAQDAVFQAKFGQLVQKYGPEGAARAWFAGEGGMNNPNADDVNGMTVARYAEKFNRGFGAQPTMGTPPPSMVAQGANAAPMPNISPQQVGALPGTPAQMPGGFTPTNMPAQSVPGGLPQVAQGDAVTGQGDVMAPPRAAPNADDPITLRAYVNSKIPGAQVMGVQGVPVYDKQGRVLIRLPNGQTDTMEVPKAKEKVGPAGPFGGSSVEAQALNMLVSNGTLTPQQAAELAAGKTITNPADGSVIFMTPSGIFGQKPGQPPQPVGSAPGGPAAAPQGAITITPPKPEKMTEGQSAAALYADRMESSEKIIAATEKAALNPTGKMLESVPFGNYLQPEAYQKFEQARRDFINAVLRRESGAVISEEEFKNAEKQYFARPGDTGDILKQKAENRRIAIEGIKRAAGPTYKKEQEAKSTPEAKPTPKVRRYNPATGTLE